jgi:hypothetical protein
MKHCVSFLIVWRGGGFEALLDIGFKFGFQLGFKIDFDPSNVSTNLQPQL